MIEYSLDNINLSGVIPSEEPDRQKHFMAKLKEKIRKQTEKLGRPLTMHCTTFGCRIV